MNFGALAFLNPMLLTALLALPILYWLLRTVPPTPRQIVFPPTRILVGIENKEKMPAKSPWWLTLLRLLAAALVIFALANPLLNPTRQQALSGTGPVVLVVDNGWASAAHWQDRLAMMDRIISNAETSNKAVMVVPTAFATNKETTKIEAPSEARTTAAGLMPQPFAPDQAAALVAIKTAIEETNTSKEDANVVWLTDGLLHKNGMSFAKSLSELSNKGTFSVIEANKNETAIGVHAGLGSEGKLIATVIRSSAGGPRRGTLHAYSARNERLGEVDYQLGAGSSAVQVAFDLPLELRNQVTRVTIAGETSSGAVALLDSRSQRQRVALLSGESLEQAQPLLGPLYYIDKALAPFSEIIKPKDANLTAGINRALEQNATVIVLADIGRLNGRINERVRKWVRRGGILVRFAGARLEKGGDSLLPVSLREGGRTLGGALSWSTPQQLAAFDDKSAFVGLDIPADVLVNRQVLADPTQISDSTQVWARLKDGTPLVTAENRGDGRVILFHVTANSDWSSLPISGLFVDMLRRITAMGGVINPAALSTGEAGDTVAAADDSLNSDASNETVLAPQQTLDGFGVMQTPPPTAQPLALSEFAKAEPNRDHPPGYYGFGAKPRALNVLGPESKLNPLPALPSNANRLQYKSDTATRLKPWLLALAFAFILLDMIAVLILQAGGLAAAMSRLTRSHQTASFVAALTTFGLSAVVLFASLPAYAQNQNGTANAPEFNLDLAIQASEKVTFGYVLTGDLKTDDASRIGLKGLGTVLNIRTAVSPGAPVGVDITRDEIAFYPILYWPILKDAQALPDAVLAKIDAYMKRGGMIIFDTRDYGQGLPTGVAIEGSGSSALRRLLGRLDIPRLEPVPQGHVLTKSFYLLRTFPGRWDGGQLWAEATTTQSQDGGDANSRQARRADGVTSILITSNDFASAWALDNRGRPLYPTIPGGEPQREMAFRTGINIVMHALTGNYKADQVHVPALLDRFGQ
ncbi:MAG: DUF4159 domain-containing protein [Hyphomicrobiaceae bacterium]